MDKSVHVVVAHCNEDVNWLKNLKYPYTIISRKGIPEETVPNKGREAAAYLEWIINNYYNIPDICIFIHAHRSDWHCKENMDEKLNKMVFNKDYYNINDGYFKLGEHKESAKILESVKDIFYETCGEIQPINIIFKYSAQFYVTKQLILKHSIDAYKKIYDWLMNAPMNSQLAATMLEYTWHIIFTGNHVDIL